MKDFVFGFGFCVLLVTLNSNARLLDENNKLTRENEKLRKKDAVKNTVKNFFDKKEA